MKSQLLIPTKIKVGYQKREDTYTKRLGYVIYYDTKGVLRKEKSWKSWITAQLGTPDFENKPIDGFVLNKDAGGKRNSWSSWNTRLEKVRVYDPRGFEFEISIPNLLFILQECTSSKGKGLEGEFIYAWDKTELVLLPVDCQEYKDCTQFTSIQTKKVEAKDVTEGHVYMNKTQENLVYMGKHPWRVSKYRRKATKGKYGYEYEYVTTVTKKHIFYNETTKSFITDSGFTKLATKVSDLVDNYAEIMDKLQSNAHMSTPDKFELRDKVIKEKEEGSGSWKYKTYGDNTLYQEKDGVVTKYQISENRVYEGSGYKSKGIHITPYSKITLTGQEVKEDTYYTDKKPQLCNTVEDLNNLGMKELYIVMKNGKKIKYSNYSIY